MIEKQILREGVNLSSLGLLKYFIRPSIKGYTFGTMLRLEIGILEAGGEAGAAFGYGGTGGRVL